MVKERNILLKRTKGDEKEKVRDYVRKHEDKNMSKKPVVVTVHWIKAIIFFMKNISMCKEK